MRVIWWNLRRDDDAAGRVFPADCREARHRSQGHHGEVLGAVLVGAALDAVEPARA